MKILYSLALILILASCSVMPPKYDNNEYYTLVKLETHSRYLQNECKNPLIVQGRLTKMLWEAEVLNSYAFFLPRNTEIYEISKILVEDVTEMKQRYNDKPFPSISYCTIKSKTFTAKARRALEAIGQLEK